MITSGLHVDLGVLAPGAHAAPGPIISQGAKAHNIALRKRAVKKNLKIQIFAGPCISGLINFYK